MQPIHICLSADNNYAQHVSVVIASVVHNLSDDYKAHFYLLDGGITDENKAKINSLAMLKDFDITYVAIDMTQFASCHINAASLALPTYFRLRIPSLLPHLQKIIYLDSDIVVDGDISPLWEIDLGDHLVGAVHDPFFWPSYFETLGITNGLYFNAGVLLMNLTQMRSQNSETKFFDVVAARPTDLVYDDQCVLNSVCHGQVLWLPPEFNFTGGYSPKNAKADFSYSPYDLLQIEKAQKTPVILHFLGAKKPWHYGCKHPSAPKYMDYIKLTPWADFKHSDKTLLKSLQKFGFMLRTEIRFFVKNLLRMLS